MWFLIEAAISGVAKGSPCDEYDNSKDMNNTEYTGDSVNNTLQNKLRLVLLYSTLLTLHGWSMAAWWWTSSWTISILPLLLEAYKGFCTPCRERENSGVSKNDEAIQMLARDMLLHCTHLHITQCCTLLMSAPWARSSSTSLGWLFLAAKYIGVNPLCEYNAQSKIESCCSV